MYRETCKHGSEGGGGPQGPPAYPVNVPTSADHLAHLDGLASGWTMWPWCQRPCFLMNRNDKKEWQAVANGLPHGSVLLCSTRTNHRQCKIQERVSAHIRATGHRVMTLSAERIAARS